MWVSYLSVFFHLPFNLRLRLLYAVTIIYYNTALCTKLRITFLSCNSLDAAFFAVAS